MSVRRRELALAAVLALVFGAAPTVGDVGSCGTTATSLDPVGFAIARNQVDCQRCGECGLTTAICQNACNTSAPVLDPFPATCHPLEHDGEVCLRALTAAPCDEYASFVDDLAPSEPTECDFCHVVPEGGLHAGDL